MKLVNIEDQHVKFVRYKQQNFIPVIFKDGSVYDFNLP